jgi:hypothetical protein
MQINLLPQEAFQSWHDQEGVYPDIHAVLSKSNPGWPELFFAVQVVRQAYFL